LSARIADSVRAVGPTLLALPECAKPTAAKIVSETAWVERFKSKAAYAGHLGVAPVLHGQRTPTRR
jgi:transposase